MEFTLSKSYCHRHIHGRIADRTAVAGCALAKTVRIDCEYIHGARGSIIQRHARFVIVASSEHNHAVASCKGVAASAFEWNKVQNTWDMRVVRWSCVYTHDIHTVLYQCHSKLPLLQTLNPNTINSRIYTTLNPITINSRGATRQGPCLNKRLPLGHGLWILSADNVYIRESGVSCGERLGV